MSKKFFYHTSSFFTLLISQETTQTLILMQLHTQVVNTRYIPDTHRILQQQCPSVLKTKCYNDRNLPFHKEVRATEIGHLFEHILLEELCIGKLANGSDSAVFNGQTKWNWIKEPRGLFHINIDAGFSDQFHLPQALEKSISITETVLSFLPSSQRVKPYVVRQDTSDLTPFLIA